MSTRSGVRAVTLVALLFGATLAGPALAAPEGETTWAVHVSLAPPWFDPAETPPVITPFMILYALHAQARPPVAPRQISAPFGRRRGHPESHAVDR